MKTFTPTNKLHGLFIVCFCSIGLVSSAQNNSTKTNRAVQNSPTNQQSNKPQSQAQVASGGQSIYIKYCLTCHQKDGSGVPNTFPPIQKSEWVNGDKTRVINIILKGLDGEIEVSGDIYSGVMPKQNTLTDLQIAELLTYIRKNFGNNASAVKASEVALQRGKNTKQH